MTALYSLVLSFSSPIGLVLYLVGPYVNTHRHTHHAKKRNLTCTTNYDYDDTVSETEVRIAYVYAYGEKSVYGQCMLCCVVLSVFNLNLS